MLAIVVCRQMSKEQAVARHSLLAMKSPSMSRPKTDIDRARSSQSRHPQANCEILNRIRLQQAIRESTILLRNTARRVEPGWRYGQCAIDEQCCELADRSCL